MRSIRVVEVSLLILLVLIVLTFVDQVDEQDLTVQCQSQVIVSRLADGESGLKCVVTCILSKSM